MSCGLTFASEERWKRKRKIDQRWIVREREIGRKKIVHRCLMAEASDTGPPVILASISNPLSMSSLPLEGTSCYKDGKIS